MLIELTDDQKNKFDLEIVKKSQRLWNESLESAEDAISLDDLNEILHKYLGI